MKAELLQVIENPDPQPAGAIDFATLLKALTAFAEKPKVDLDKKLALRIDEAAEILSMSKRTVEELISIKKLGHIKEGRITLITRNQINDYLKMRELEQGWKPK